MHARFHNAHKHSAAYYETVLSILITCRADAKTYAQTADALNAQATHTPTGQAWTDQHIKQTLKTLRGYKLYPSRMHHHLMELVFEGVFSVKQALTLLQYTRLQA